ncbi:IspD/TarI family cytidylyltransferase [Hoyosella subflava]|uniref:4-diphosphocytidyl-2C-methyl-D-erythritol synthase n=1 Tax=Hoyosella subflava (strain DSM 45089 / JCM 17490 / NBRC 109087 / DQS3-9A1) TaxID=443218 RepID=F6EN17_HOYSD|nr:2-C-methyl-D-erythritol 4-phosphate cytidylyltransferase [Hoyosella subflava]AEF39334.1 4-diphosphocytidyl-2C-methyl-D-erythritol synthase [Hoyosella subflava DQS3-9A1]
MTDPVLVLPVPRDFADNRAAIFSRLGHDTPLVYCLRAMLAGAAVGTKTLVPVVTSLIAEVREVVAASELRSVEVIAADGEGTRRDCVTAALSELAESDYSEAQVVLHDLRYPLASSSLWKRVVDRLLEGACDVAVPALSMIDSVKAVDHSGVIAETVDRSLLRSVQFPRGFRAGVLQQIADNTAVQSPYDELTVAVRLGFTVALVDGDPDAFAAKIPQDSALVNAIIECRREGQR